MDDSKSDNHEQSGDDHAAEGAVRLGSGRTAKEQVQRVFKTGGPIPEGNQPVSNMPIDAGRLFEQALEQTRMAVALADPNAPDSPLVFVNKAFEVLTGYDRREAVGRNCRFLQTPNTSKREMERLRKALATEDTVVVELENRRKDGTLFVNALHVGPIYDGNGRLTHFYGSQWDISELVEQRAELVRSGAVTEELRHRIGNLFTVISSIVRLSGRNEKDAAVAIEKANDRILALARAHAVSTTSGAGEGGPTGLHGLVETIISPYRLSAQGRIVLGGKPVDLPVHTVTPIGLALHELATNAVKYGALRRADGKVSIEWTVEGDELHIVWDEDSGNRVGKPREDTGTGTRILEGVMASVRGSITFHWREKGMRAVVAIPMTDSFQSG